MRNYLDAFKKFQINEKDFPEYSNADDFARQFKKCSIYKYRNISYSNDSNLNSDKKK